jgi:HPt (histidine-containing phosphotransfer) domain-containing protein
MRRQIIDSSVLDDYRQVMGNQGDAFVRDLVRAFIDDTNGLGELLSRAWNNKDQKAFQRAVHSMKTTSKTMGAMPLAGQFEVLEQQAMMGILDDETLFQETISSLDKAREELTRLYLQSTR